MGQLVSVDRQGAVATLLLDAPPLNAFDTAMRDALAAAVRDIDADPGVRAVVLTGGEKVFAAGADIQALLAMDFVDIVDWNARLQRTFTSVADLPMPVVAAINGYALGGGLELALCADYRVAGERAAVALPEVTLGIMPGSGGTQRLTEIVGRSRAKELIMTGRRLRSAEAHELGIVDEVVAGSATDRAHELAARFAAAPRHAVRAIKQAVDQAGGAREAGLALERSLIAGLFATPDRTTGMQSFLTDGPGHARFE
jgi:enoyl-CoA hydratase/carnithine racemase